MNSLKNFEYFSKIGCLPYVKQQERHAARTKSISCETQSEKEKSIDAKQVVHDNFNKWKNHCINLLTARLSRWFHMHR